MMRNRENNFLIYKAIKNSIDFVVINVLLIII